MKKTIAFCLSLILSSNFFAQTLSVELSIEWKREPNVFVGKDTVNTPYLNITYKNFTNKSIYFLRVCEANRFGLPFSPNGINFVTSSTFCERAKNHLDYSGNHFNVVIGQFCTHLKSGWDIMINNNIFDNSSLMDNLWDIYNCIYLSKADVVNADRISNFFKESDITEDSISIKLRNQFLFLKSKECHTDFYSLEGFKITRGSFNFLITLKKLPNFVNIEPLFNERKQRFNERKIFLPKLIHGYQLYSGAFQSNQIKILFDP